MTARNRPTTLPRIVLALAVGAACGVALVVFFTVAPGAFQPLPVVAAPLGGPLTALAVWTIAYRRRKRPDLSLVFS